MWCISLFIQIVLWCYICHICPVQNTSKPASCQTFPVFCPTFAVLRPVASAFGFGE